MGGSPQPVPEFSPVVSGITARMAAAAAPTTPTPPTPPTSTPNITQNTPFNGSVSDVEDIRNYATPTTPTEPTTPATPPVTPPTTPTTPVTPPVTPPTTPTTPVTPPVTTPTAPPKTTYEEQLKAWNQQVSDWNSRSQDYQFQHSWENPYTKELPPSEVLYHKVMQPIAPQVSVQKLPQVAPAIPIKQAFVPPMAPIAVQPIIDPGKETSLTNPIQSSATPAPTLNLPQGTVTGTNLGGAPPSIFAPQAGAGSRPWSSGFTPPAPYQPTPSQSGGGIGTTLASGSPPPVSGKMSPTPMSTIGEVQKNQVPSTPNTGPNRGSPGAAASVIQYANQPVSSKNQVSPFAGEGLRFGGF